MKNTVKLKEELKMIVNKLFAYQRKYEMTDSQHNDLKEIMNHVQNILNILEDYDE